MQQYLKNIKRELANQQLYTPWKCFKREVKDIVK